MLQIICSGLRSTASFVSLPGGLGSVTATVTYLRGEKKVSRQLASSCNQTGVEGRSPQFDGLAAAGEEGHRGLLEKALELGKKAQLSNQVLS